MKILSLLLLLLPTSTTSYRPEGFPCRAHFQCESSYCNETRQCQPKKPNAAACTVHDACTSGRCAGNVCQVQYVNGTGPCVSHADCEAGFCNGTTYLCQGLKPKQSPCEYDFECNSGRCTANPPRCEFVIYENAICGKNSDCYGDRCKFKWQGGDNRCYPRKWNNERCNHNDDCLSLRCETQNCTEPVWLGMPCDEPSDCYSLYCNLDKGCVATAEEASNNEFEDNIPGSITGSVAQEFASGGGSVDISTGEPIQGNIYEADGTINSGAWSEMKRVGMAMTVGLIGAALAMRV